MKKVYCYSREGFKKLLTTWPGENLPAGTAVISIAETPECRKYYGWESEELHLLPSGPEVLNLEFDDISEETRPPFTGMTQDQARQIIEFIDSHKDCDLVVHCRAGKSRSQGVVRFILDYYPEIWGETNPENPCVSPNYFVVAGLKRILWKNLTDQCIK